MLENASMSFTIVSCCNDPFANGQKNDVADQKVVLSSELVRSGRRHEQEIALRQVLL